MSIGTDLSLSRTFSAAVGEKVATNILANRLATLQDAGIINSPRDPQDGRRVRQLTPKGHQSTRDPG